MPPHTYVPVHITTILVVSGFLVASSIMAMGFTTGREFAGARYSQYQQLTPDVRRPPPSLSVSFSETTLPISSSSRSPSESPSESPSHTTTPSITHSASSSSSLSAIPTNSHTPSSGPSRTRSTTPPPPSLSSSPSFLPSPLPLVSWAAPEELFNGTVPKVEAYVAISRKKFPRNATEHEFYKRWKAVWPDLNITYVQPRVSQGKLEDLFQIFLEMLDIAEASDADFFLLFEDDALPFTEGVKWPDALYANLAELPHNAMLLLGTHFEYPAPLKVRKDIEENVLPSGKHVYRINSFARSSYGTYGQGIWRELIADTRATWARHYEPGGPRVVDSGARKNLERYVSTPLLVDHPLRGYRRVGNDWYGHRDWWRYPTR